MGAIRCIDEIWGCVCRNGTPKKIAFDKSGHMDVELDKAGGIVVTGGQMDS